MLNYSPPRLRVLWADDQPENNAPMVGDLERRKVHVSFARTTDLALTLLARNSYLAVISDMGRREGPREGFHPLDAMRARGDETPFFIYASLSDPALLDEALIHDAQRSSYNWGLLLSDLDALINASKSTQGPRTGNAA